MPSVAKDLKELLKTVLAEGAYGLTVRTGELPVIHYAKGSQLIEGTYPTHEEVSSLLQELVLSREMRQFREQGVVHFTQTLDGHVRLLGGARKEKDEIHLELRRMAS